MIESFLMVDFIPIRFDKSHLTTIGERLYSQSLDLIRELVANAYDADATQVRINVADNTLTVEDNGTGMDREGLKQYLTIGSVFKKDNPVSPKFERVRIGEFGIGKFAVLSICDRFEIYTSTGSFAATLIFNRQDFEARETWDIPLIEHKAPAAESGTLVTLNQVRKPISQIDIERHLIQIFPLNDRNFSIFLNNQKLASKFIAGERFKIREKTRFGDINGEVILASLVLPGEMVGIGIRVKGILIKRHSFNIESDHSISVRRLTGEIRADFLPITASRNDFISDCPEYHEFVKIMTKKLRRVVKSIQDSVLSYKDKRAEQLLSEALLNIREALKRNRNILLLDSLPLFSRKKSLLPESNIKSGPIATALDKPAVRDKDEKENLREALKKMKPKIRGRIKTLLRDDRRIIKKVKIGGTEFLVSFTRLPEEDKESFTEGGIIYINRAHVLFRKTEGKSELTLYHLIRLVTQEIIKLTQVRNLETAYDWQGKLIKDAFTGSDESD